MNTAARQLQIGERFVGDAHPTLVIAEIGVNHDGTLSRAIELVHRAADAGADAIKLQLFSADRLVHASAAAASYQSANCGAVDQASLLRKYELSESEVRCVIEKAIALGLLTLATPFSREDVALIERLNLPAIKIASPDLVNTPLLNRAADFSRPLLVSTGASTAAEIRTCVATLALRNARCALLHCVSSYPTAKDLAHLSWIDQLRAEFPATVVGYSDHTTEPLAGAFAVSAGAAIVEKHLTWNRDAAGPDHAASADPKQFAEYVRAIRLAEQMRGADCGPRRVLPVEADVRKLSRQSLVAVQSLRAGEVIDESSLTIKRPGTGIPAALLSEIVGRRVRCDIAAGMILSWEMLDEKAGRSSAA